MALHIVPHSSGPADAIDAVDSSGRKLAQLRSLLMSMYGVGRDGFENIGAGHRDNLLWLASDLAEQLAELREIAHHG